MRLSNGWHTTLIDSPVANTSAPLTVERFDNHVYFYAAVDPDRCLALIRSLRELDAQLRSERITRMLDAPIPIWLHIQSPGGDLFSAFAVADQIELLQSPVYAIAEGVCASAATVIFLACSKRYVLSHSFLLIHQLSSVAWGTHEEFKDEMKLQELLMDKLVNFYVNRSNMSKEEVRGLLLRNSWLDLEGVLQRGLANVYA